MELDGKRIIVTGSARGMGAATVRAYVAAGATVVGMDVLDDMGAEVAAEANAQGPGSASYLSVDVSDLASTEAAFAQAVEQMGGGGHRASEASPPTTAGRPEWGTEPAGFGPDSLHPLAQRRPPHGPAPPKPAPHGGGWGDPGAP